MRTLEGKVVAKEMKVGIVAARFNEFIVSKLVAGARDGLLRHDVSLQTIFSVRQFTQRLLYIIISRRRCGYPSFKESTEIETV